MARDMAFTHHERFNGTGYPYGLAGSQIPLCGRITAVADVYDALTSKRVYKPEYSHDTSKDIISEGRGTQFDPFLVDVFLSCEEQFIQVRERFQSLDKKRLTTDPGQIERRAENGKSSRGGEWEIGRRGDLSRTRYGEFAFGSLLSAIFHNRHSPGGADGIKFG